MKKLSIISLKSIPPADIVKSSSTQENLPEPLPAAIETAQSACAKKAIAKPERNTLISPDADENKRPTGTIQTARHMATSRLTSRSAGLKLRNLRSPVTEMESAHKQNEFSVKSKGKATASPSVPLENQRTRRSEDAGPRSPSAYVASSKLRHSCSVKISSSKSQEPRHRPTNLPANTQLKPKTRDSVRGKNEAMTVSSRPSGTTRQKSSKEPRVREIDSFTAIEPSATVVESVESDPNCNPTFKKRISTSVKDILQKRTSRIYPRDSLPSSIQSGDGEDFDIEREFASLAADQEIQDHDPSFAVRTEDLGNSDQVESDRPSVNTNRSSFDSVNLDKRNEERFGSVATRFKRHIAVAAVSLADKIAKNLDLSET